jgi:hypothetical protein
MPVHGRQARFRGNTPPRYTVTLFYLFLWLLPAAPCLTMIAWIATRKEPKP